MITHIFLAASRRCGWVTGVRCSQRISFARTRFDGLAMRSYSFSLVLWRWNSISFPSALSAHNGYMIILCRGSGGGWKKAKSEYTSALQTDRYLKMLVDDKKRHNTPPAYVLSPISRFDLFAKVFCLVVGRSQKHTNTLELNADIAPRKKAPHTWNTLSKRANEAHTEKETDPCANDIRVRVVKMDYYVSAFTLSKCVLSCVGWHDRNCRILVELFPGCRWPEVTCWCCHNSKSLSIDVGANATRRIVRERERDWMTEWWRQTKNNGNKLDLLWNIRPNYKKLWFHLL